MYVILYVRLVLFSGLLSTASDQEQVFRREMFSRPTPHSDALQTFTLYIRMISYTYLHSSFSAMDEVDEAYVVQGCTNTQTQHHSDHTQQSNSNHRRPEDYSRRENHNLKNKNYIYFQVQGFYFGVIVQLNRLNNKQAIVKLIFKFS